MPNWTPGPWTSAVLPWAVMQRGRVILTTSVDVQTVPEQEAIGNATLASAAPELYDALEQSCEFVESILTQFSPEARATMVRSWRAALAKASPSEERRKIDLSSFTPPQEIVVNGIQYRKVD